MREISQRGTSIMWKSRRRTRQMLSRKMKCSLRNYKMTMKSSRVSTSQMKSQDEKLENLR
jgi:hypothetical protein